MYLQIKHLYKKTKNYVGSEIHSPFEMRKRSHFVTGCRKTPPPPQKKIEWDSCYAVTLFCTLFGTFKATVQTL
jgi:hypothetical protein